MASSGEWEVFYQTMKADLHRYMAQFSSEAKTAEEAIFYMMLKLKIYHIERSAAHELDHQHLLFEQESSGISDEGMFEEEGMYDYDSDDRDDVESYGPACWE